MKKKLLAILMVTAMSMSLIACGGGEEEVATEEVVEEEATEEVAEETADVEYTEEQVAFADEFNTMVDEYNAAIDVINATPELAENQELVDIMNTLTDAINEVSEICEDPSLLTEENMELLRTTYFAETYKLIDEIHLQKVQKNLCSWNKESFWKREYKKADRGNYTIGIYW